VNRITHLFCVFTYIHAPFARFFATKMHFCLLTKVRFLFIQAAGLAYHHDAVVDIIKGGEPPLYLITRQRASSCGLM
jgi:hypothetical protein